MMLINASTPTSHQANPITIPPHKNQIMLPSVLNITLPHVVEGVSCA
ncbi:Uncharacterised protein [Vibrio cholerae]|nr:Uncharacterised protein [Vibrio cholerae]CSB35221.1 Uncharacterised protein [Vibrio cholerae]